MMNNNEDDMSLITQMYPGVYPETAQHKGNNSNNSITCAAPKRRRRKSNSNNKSSEGNGKRKLSSGQVVSLEKSFEDEHKLESERKDRLAKELGLDPRQVAVWFQNRRARWKNKKLEEEYSALKSMYDNSVLQNSHLHSQVLKLTDQLNEAKREIQRLAAEQVEIGSSHHSPISSLSAVETPFFGDFVAASDYDYDYDYDYEPGPAAALYAGPTGDMEWMMGGLYM